MILIYSPRWCERPANTLLITINTNVTSSKSYICFAHAI